MNLQTRLTKDSSMDVPSGQAGVASTDARTPGGVRFLTKAQVLSLLGDISATSLWELQVKADFPKARVLLADPNGVTGRSYFVLAEVEAWMLSRPKRVLRSDRSTEGAQ